MEIEVNLRPELLLVSCEAHEEHLIDAKFSANKRIKLFETYPNIQ